jgi:hypothetical protein
MTSCSGQTFFDNIMYQLGASDTGFCKLFLRYDLGNSVFNVHQVPKVRIHVHQHQIPQVHA